MKIPTAPASTWQASPEKVRHLFRAQCDFPNVHYDRPLSREEQTELMRIIDPSTRLGLSSHHQAAAFLSLRSAASIGAGGSGAYVLARPRRSVVYKLSDDPGMAAFASFIRTNPSLPGLPTIYGITGAHLEWTGLILEKLRPMTSTESASWSSWFVAEIIQTKCTPLTDPFGLATAACLAFQHASASGVGVDLLKPDNVMVSISSGVIVLSDPFF